MLVLIPTALILLGVGWLLVRGDGEKNGEEVARSDAKVAPKDPDVVLRRDEEDAAIQRLISKGISSFDAGGRRKRQVALTFDDGPGSDTGKILRILRRFKTPSTFFVVGTMVSNNAKTLRHIVREGHAIGSHTESHPMMGEMDVGSQGAEMKQVDAAIKSAQVERQRLFRPPYRSFNNDTLRLLKKRGDLMILWDVDSEDYANPDPQEMAKRVVREAKPGSVILMHDGPAERTATRRALPDIIKGLKRRRFNLVTVPEMVRTNPPPARNEISPGEVRKGGS